MVDSVCQKTCIVIAAVFGVLAGLVVLVIGLIARIAYKAALAGKTIYEVAEEAIVNLSGDSLVEKREHIEDAFRMTAIVVYVLIALGCVIMLTNFIGCYGALCSSLCMTYIYFVFQILLMCVSIAIATVLFVGQEQLVSWFRSENNCEICSAIVDTCNFASPIAGVFIFAALCQALTIYCAWIVAERIKDGTLIRKGRGMVMFQPPSTLTTTVVVAR